MTQAYEYALLAAGSYNDIRVLLENKAPIPPGWAELTQYAISTSGTNGGFFRSGLSARVYQGPGGEIVISLAGTEFAASAGSVADFLNGNIPLAFGKASAQAYEAAVLYQRVKNEQGPNITFTGHSLGGGLASVMAVWFNQPARVFAPRLFKPLPMLPRPPRWQTFFHWIAPFPMCVSSSAAQSIQRWPATTLRGISPPAKATSALGL